MNLVAAPILVPLAGAALCLLAHRHVRVQRVVAVLSASALLASSVSLLLLVLSRGRMVLQVAGWEAPYGITLVADVFAAIMATINGIIGLAVIVYSLGMVDTGRERGAYHPLVLALLTGVSGSFLSGDLFNVYVWFEVMLMASFVLLALGGTRGQLEGAIKYLTLNLLSSLLFLSAAGLLYGFLGTLNLAHLAVRVTQNAGEPAITAVAMLLLTAFSIKAALFPVFFWLPASYHTPPAPLAALFGGLLTKVGVYAIIRVFSLVFPSVLAEHALLFVWVSALTMLTGVLGAAAQHEIRRILAFHIVSQVGYMIMGLAVAATVLARLGRAPAPEVEGLVVLALAGSIFYVFHHIIVKTNLFLIAGAVLGLRQTGELSDLGGTWSRCPGLGLFFLISALSLAGVPPLSGFWAKLALLRAGLEADTPWLVATALVVSLLTLYSMSKIWLAVFWGPVPDPAVRPAELPIALPPPTRELSWATLGPIAVLAGLTLTIGLGAGTAYELAEQAAQQLFDRQGYIDAVLPGVAAPDLAAGDS